MDGYIYSIRRRDAAHTVQAGIRLASILCRTPPTQEACAEADASERKNQMIKRFMPTGFLGISCRLCARRHLGISSFSTLLL